MNTVTFYPLNKTVAVAAGTTVLHAAAQAGITIGGLCGEAMCGRCRMILCAGSIVRRSDGKLTPAQIAKGYFLSCSATTSDCDITVDIPPETLAADSAAISQETRRFEDLAQEQLPADRSLTPLVRKLFLAMDPPTITSNLADLERVCAAAGAIIGAAPVCLDLSIIKSIPVILRSAEYRVTAAVSARGELLEVTLGDTSSRNYIAAADIGTTTVAVRLIDAVAGKVIAARADFNSQGVHGAEVTRRLIAAEKIGVEELQKLIVDDLNRLIAGCANDAKVSLDDITALVCAGNTAMAHFLLALPFDRIRRTPYVAASLAPPPVRAAELGVRINAHGMLYTVPGIGSWVGGDITAGILAAGMHRESRITLLADIGTNGEIVVGNRDWLMACSASAGPALEGAGVQCGMRAESGAIERVSAVDGRIEYRTIGGGPPRGICGSGIIDGVATLLRLGIIDRSGHFTGAHDNRIIEIDGVKACLLARAEECLHGQPVFLSASDIENVVYAKAAIFAAIKILLQRLELTYHDIERFVMAGAFGSYINIESAVAIGLTPPIPPSRVEFAGNASLRGATRAALCAGTLEEMAAIARATVCYDLMGAADYIEEFRKALFLPHTDIELFASENIFT